MKVGYVVLYVSDTDTCARFWTDTVGMVERQRFAVGSLSVVEVGFADQEFSLQLVPLERSTARRSQAHWQPTGSQA